MIRSISVFVFAALTASASIAETQQMKLLSSDGSPATDAKAVAILTLPGARLDEQLNELPSHDNTERTASLTKVAVNEAGSITFDKSALAVVASNEHGFAFIPSEAYRDEVKLRPWATVEIDATTLSKPIADQFRLRVSWTNSYAAAFMPPANLPPPQGAKPDWRLQQMVMIDQIVESTERVSIRVPPGEFQLMLVEKRTVRNVEVDDVVPRGYTNHVGLGIFKAQSGETTSVSIPPFGSVTGRMTTGGLPDWDGSRGSGLIRAELVGTSGRFPINFRQVDPFAGETGTQLIQNEYARFYATEEGFKFRNEKAIFALAKIAQDGSFRFDILPVGKHSFLKIQLPAQNRSGTAHGTTEILTYANGGKMGPGPVSGGVRSGETLDLGDLNSNHPNLPDEGFVLRGLEYPTHLVVGGTTVGNASPPRLPYPGNAAYPEQFPVGVLPPGVSGGMPGIIEMQLPGFPPAPVDPEQAIIERLLKLLGPDADRDEIQKQLREHLLREFDAKQKSRDDEISRLQKLIDESKARVSQRQQQRDQIVDQRVQELLKQVGDK